ncbi:MULTISPECIES: META domain-containing protein [unclassified Helicobacter]|uniref:META domain-containing protein n=1 Tax=unclassified Helicobacter TaxID=2593540 RepID=UPI000CF05B98|nr:MULTISPECIES: META domain-containing protein [unclassified Helicobacter]
MLELQVVRLFFYFLATFFLAGCSFFNIFQGSFSQDNWEIQKIVIHGQEYLGVGGLRELALQKLQEEGDSQGMHAESNQDGENTQDFIDEMTPQDDMEKNSEGTLEDLQELAQTKEVSTLTFNTSQNKIFGVAACNNFSADYSWKDADNIEIYEVNITRKLCSPSQVMTFELRFAGILKNIFFVEKKGKDSMILKNKDVQIYLKAR